MLVWPIEPTLRTVEPDGPGLNRTNSEQSHRGPWIIAKTCPNFAFVCGFDDEQRPLAVSDWAARDDEAIVYEAVHERRVLVPGMLFPDRERGVPARAVDRCQRKQGRDVNVVMGFEGSIIHAIAVRACVATPTPLRRRRAVRRPGAAALWPAGSTL